MKDKGATTSYDVSVFQVLTDESDGDDPKIADAKIKRTLRRRKLAAYDQKRISALRGLRDELKAEITKFQRSKYYCGTPDKSPLDHFNYDAMVAEFVKRHPNVKATEMGGIIGYALYYYYLR